MRKTNFLVGLQSVCIKIENRFWKVQFLSMLASLQYIALCQNYVTVWMLMRMQENNCCFCKIYKAPSADKNCFKYIAAVEVVRRLHPEYLHLLTNHKRHYRSICPFFHICKLDLLIVSYELRLVFVMKKP